jgi:hypothetical protein
MIPCGIVRDGEPSLLSIACKRKNWDSREGFLPREVVTLLERSIRRKALDLAISNRMTESGGDALKITNLSHFKTSIIVLTTKILK